MDNAVYITTPIYYVNDAPHIGSAYTTLACDAYARYRRCQGRDVYFLTGTDEHGQKVEKAAQQASMEPQDFVDKVSQSFKKLLPIIQVQPDDFIRTTEERHRKAAQHLWQTLDQRGQIYLGEYSGWYSIRDEAFYGEAELVDGKAPSGAPVEWVTEESYFFKLSEWQDKLLAHYRDNPDFIAPEGRRNEVIKFVEGGLHDLSISRTSFKWGIRVPNSPNHIMYVWLDALTNYITALGYPDNTTNLQKYWPQAIHVIGKDILRFHAVYWPAFLMAAGLELPKKVFAHGWWTNNGQKISKSLGNTIDPVELTETFGADTLRYFLLREVPFGNDGDFLHQNLIQRYNSDLANAYGNLVQRVLQFIYKNCAAKIPAPHDLNSKDEAMLVHIPGVMGILDKSMDAMAFNQYAEHIWQVISFANCYIDEQKPWVLKDSDNPRLNSVLYVLAETIRQIAIVTQPILPNASGEILNQLNWPLGQRNFVNLQDCLIPGTVIREPVGIFPRWKG